MCKSSDTLYKNRLANCIYDDIVLVNGEGQIQSVKVGLLLSLSLFLSLPPSVCVSLSFPLRTRFFFCKNFIELRICAFCRQYNVQLKTGECIMYKVFTTADADHTRSPFPSQGWIFCPANQDMQSLQTSSALPT